MVCYRTFRMYRLRHAHELHCKIILTKFEYNELEFTDCYGNLIQTPSLTCSAHSTKSTTVAFFTNFQNIN